MSKRKSALSELLAEAGARVENGVETGLADGALAPTEGFDANGSPVRDEPPFVAPLLSDAERAAIIAEGPGPLLPIATPDELGLTQVSDHVPATDEEMAAILAALDDVTSDTTDLPQAAILIEPSPVNANGTINSGFDFWSKRS